MKTKSRQASPVCSLCESPNKLSGCEGGYICDTCVENHRAGRDNTTRDAKSRAAGWRDRSEVIRTLDRGEPVDPDLAYRAASSERAEEFSEEHKPPAVLLGAGQEAVPVHLPEMANTMANPSAVALDASAQRVELLGQIGVDAVALGLDVAETIGAQNSLEKMLAHQMGALHQAMFNCLTKSAMATNTNDAIRYMNMAMKIARTFQGGMETLKRMRSSGQQSITVQHVTVSDGGQAVIGEVRAGGGQCN